MRVDTGSGRPERGPGGGAGGADRLDDERAAVAAALDEQCPALVAGAKALAAAFGGGGTLFAVGDGPFAADAEHVAVEFLHPVVVGRPALPALALRGPAGGDADPSLGALAHPGDALVTIGGCAGEPVPGLVTVALAKGDGARGATCGVDLPVSDPWLAKEAFVVCYHLLWEVTHLFLAEDGLGDGAEGSDLGATAALYPFLAGGAGGGGGAGSGGVDGTGGPGSGGVDRTGGRDASGGAGAPAGGAQEAAALSSCRAKVAETADLRTRALAAEGGRLDACAAAVAAALRRGGAVGPGGGRPGGRVWACGNGGSSTDAASLADALTRVGPGTRVPARALSAEPATVTALANDLGYERVFARQVAALGRPGDVVVGMSTSGNSANVLAAFEEARRRGLLTVGFAGYDGGDMASSGLVDHLFVVPSASVHRVQEVQAALYLSLARRIRAAESAKLRT